MMRRWQEKIIELQHKHAKLVVEIVLTNEHVILRMMQHEGATYRTLERLVHVFQVERAEFDIVSAMLDSMAIDIYAQKVTPLMVLPGGKT